MRRALDWAERGLLPDAVIRAGIRRLLTDRIRQEDAGSDAGRMRRLTAFAQSLREAPIAVTPQVANDQHYELPPAFFEQVLGPRLKYSCCFWPEGVGTLDEAEAAMLDLTCRRAGLADGMSILELGCGWGSMTLWMARQFPTAAITAVSNSAPQRRFIEARCRERGLGNVTVVTCDMNRFDPGETFDAVVSIEMFEHMRNLPLLLQRISGWMRPGAPLFVHVFSHKRFAYLFESEGDDNWMGRYFFTAGMMPSHDLLPMFQDDLTLEKSWRVSGTHYEQTAAAWLARLDAGNGSVVPVLESTCDGDSRRWLGRWRLFFMACDELFGFRDGAEWGVSHYRFRK